jgi:hypothetical protein
MRLEKYSLTLWDSPVVRAVLDKLGERLQKIHPSQQFALQKSPLRSILQRPVYFFQQAVACNGRGRFSRICNRTLAMQNGSKTHHLVGCRGSRPDVVDVGCLEEK